MSQEEKLKWTDYMLCSKTPNSSIISFFQKKVIMSLNHLRLCVRVCVLRCVCNVI